MLIWYQLHIIPDARIRCLYGQQLVGADAEVAAAVVEHDDAVEDKAADVGSTDDPVVIAMPGLGYSSLPLRHLQVDEHPSPKSSFIQQINN
jgi:hypothetical protein